MTSQACTEVWVETFVGKYSYKRQQVSNICTSWASGANICNSICLLTSTTISPAPVWKLALAGGPNRLLRESRENTTSSLDLTWHHKSAASYLDIQAAWRLELTITKGSETVSSCLKKRKPSPHSSITLLPLQPFILSLFSLSVITPALPSVAWGVAGQKSLVNMNLQIVCEEESYLLMVSVETLGCKQPAPVRPSWGGQVRILTLGNNVCM